MSRNICYQTPPWLANLLVEEYGIDPDDACLAEARAICPEVRGLLFERPLCGQFSLIFCNPPFAEPMCAKKSRNRKERNHE